jgi:hypothetical protein
MTSAPEVIVIGESDADVRMAIDLAARVLVEAIDWLEPNLLSGCLTWSGLEPGSVGSHWQDVTITNDLWINATIPDSN